MAPPFERTASELEQLNERVRKLERRVAALESPSRQPGALADDSGGEMPNAVSPSAPLRTNLPVGIPSGMVPTLGKAVLGFAGAYLLRAIAESGVIPKQFVLAVAIGYAGLWLVWAARTNAVSRFAGVTYAVTSALILSPLLWESTVRLQLLSTTLAGIVLVAFVALGFALARRSNLQVVPWVATLATVITALALIVSTQALVPFTTALLAVAIFTEFAACFGYWTKLRVIPALAADFAVWLLVDVMTARQGVPAGYHPASATTIIFLCFGLLAIYGGSIGIRTLALRGRISVFETIQTPVAVVLSVLGIMRAGHGSAGFVPGGVLALLTALCYWGALFRFADAAHTRNRRVYATWAAALLIAISSLFLSVKVAVPFLCLAAMVAVFTFRRTGKFSLGIHVSFFLAAAAALSSLLSYAGNALAGRVEGAPPPEVWIVTMSAVAAYLIGSRGTQNRKKQRLLWVTPLVLVGLAGAAAAVVAIAQLAGRSQLSAARLSVIRTLVICSLAWIFAFLGSRSKRAEFGWVAYAAVGFGTLKLLFEDLRYGNPASLVASLLFYGLVLILLPRLTRRSQTQG